MIHVHIIIEHFVPEIQKKYVITFSQKYCSIIMVLKLLQCQSTDQSPPL